MTAATRRVLTGSKKKGYRLHPDAQARLPEPLTVQVVPYHVHTTNGGHIRGWRWAVRLVPVDPEKWSKWDPWWDFQKHEDLEGVGYTRADLEEQINEAIDIAARQWVEKIERSQGDPA